MANGGKTISIGVAPTRYIAHSPFQIKGILRGMFSPKRRNSNLKVLKVYFDKYCYCNFKVRFLKTSYFHLRWKTFGKDLFNWAKIFRIWCSEYGLWDKHRTLSCRAFCRIYVLKGMLDFLDQIKLLIISCVSNFSKISLLIIVFF